MITNYCDECVNFQPGESEKNLCALAKKLSFKAPENMFQVMSHEWGHYFEACKDFKKIEEDGKIQN